MNTKELIDAAVSLPVDERAMVVDSLLRSLNMPETAIDDKWALVAQQRLDDVKAGTVETVSGQQVFDKIWKRLER